MDLKDWLTLGTSWAALGVAGYSLFRTVRRDQREAAAKDPTADVLMPICRGYGPWDVRIGIENRLNCRIDIEGVFLPTGGPLRIVERQRVRAETIRDRLGRKVDLAGTGGYADLGAGESLRDLVYIEPLDGRPLGGPTPADFMILYRRHTDRSRLHRLPMRMIARP